MTATAREWVMREVEQLPEAAIAALAALLPLIRSQETSSQEAHEDLQSLVQSHERARILTASSPGDWADALIRERDDRL